MIFVLKDGNRVWFETDITKDKNINNTQKVKGVLLSVIKYDNNFDYWFCKNDIMNSY